jgi:cold-inducible RNA-binding protein
MKKLYVGNLSYDVTGDQLQELFGQAGQVASAIVIVDRQTNRSKGFGFVEFTNDEEADKAISMFHDQDFQGRKMIVNEARPMQPRGEFKPRQSFQPKGDY